MQVGTPSELYDNPVNVFLAGFIGSPATNLLTVPFLEGKARLGTRTIDLPAPAADALAKNGRSEVVLGLRPEALLLSTEQDGWPARVIVVEDLGADAYVFTEAQFPGATKEIVIRVDGRFPPSRGDLLFLKGDPEQTHLFDPVSGDRLPT